MLPSNKPYIILIQPKKNYVLKTFPTQEGSGMLKQVKKSRLKSHF